jgi:hypothetical protein
MGVPRYRDIKLKTKSHTSTNIMMIIIADYAGHCPSSITLDMLGTKLFYDQWD